MTAIIEDKIFCVHGGISPSLKNIEQLLEIKRPTEIPCQGIICDILWSDPLSTHVGWKPNSRGISFTFGIDALQSFLKKNNFDLICRAHQVVEDGYEFFGDKKLVTVFSAPNYCGEFDNSAAMLIIDEKMICSFNILKPSGKFL